MSMRRTLAFIVLAMCVPAAGMRAQEAARDPSPRPGSSRATASDDTRSAKTWVNKVAEIEDYMRTAAVVRMEGTPRGVTRATRAFFARGALVESMAWKPLSPGMRQGYFESYKSEIAAYEISKLLALDMVPPKVERQINSETGCAILWATPTRSFADVGFPVPPPDKLRSWMTQMARAMMFDNLFGNIDPNLGNWLVDPAWNLIIIDHSRALTTTMELPHRMIRVDGALWTRIQRLTPAQLTVTAGRWLGPAEIQAILARRTKMQAQIDELVRQKGAAHVFGK